MSSQDCDYDPQNERDLPAGALMICPACGHWIYAGMSHRTGMQFPPPKLDAWMHDAPETKT
jgi:hypothetical protein